MCPLQRGFISKCNTAAPSGNEAKRTHPSALSIIQKKSLHISSSGLLQVSLLRIYTVMIQLTVSVPESHFSAENGNHAEEQPTTTSNYQLKKKSFPLKWKDWLKIEERKRNFRFILYITIKTSARHLLDICRNLNKHELRFQTALISQSRNVLDWCPPFLPILDRHNQLRVKQVIKRPQSRQKCTELQEWICRTWLFPLTITGYEIKIRGQLEHDVLWC